MNAGKYRIVVADDHPVVRMGVRAIVMGEPDLEVIGEASNGKEALEQVALLKPDILLLDLQMPQLPGLDALREITDLDDLRVRTILLTSKIDQREILEALQLGARGILMKESVASDLITCLRAVMLGDHWLNGRSVNNLVQVLRDLMAQQNNGKSAKFGLTVRELSVVRYIVEGCTNKDIARECNIAEETVKRHLKNIFDKTGVSNRLELAMFALNHHLAEGRSRTPATV